MADQGDDPTLEQFRKWKKRYASKDETARELFRQLSQISVCMAYDLIDKLRWWEKESLKLPDEEIDKRLGHMSAFLERLKAAYLAFAETDF